MDAVESRSEVDRPTPTSRLSHRRQKTNVFLHSITLRKTTIVASQSIIQDAYKNVLRCKLQLLGNYLIFCFEIKRVTCINFANNILKNLLI